MAVDVDNVMPFLDWTADSLRPLGVFQGPELRAESVFRFVVVFIALQWAFRLFISTLYPKAHPQLKRFGGPYLVSTLVSLYTSVRGSILFYALLKMPPSVQYHGIVPPELTAAESEVAERLIAHAAFTSEVFLGYILSDSVVLAFNFGEYGKVDMVIHHIGFTLCGSLSHYYAVMLLTFSWLVQGEWSSIFLNVRWVRRKCDLSTRVADVLFAVTFFITRVGLYGFGLVHLGRTVYFNQLEPHPSMPVGLRNLVVILVAGFFTLNLFWFRTILKIASGKNRRIDLQQNGQEKRLN